MADRQQDKEIISNLHNLVVINPSLQHLSERLKRIVPTAVDRAVAEIIGPVVDRSVQIACVSTESLILRVGALWRTLPSFHADQRISVQMECHHKFRVTFCSS